MSAILELGASIRTRRCDMGLTQTALARLSGLSRATVNQTENGSIKDLSLTRAAKLLGTLGLSIQLDTARPRPVRQHRSKSPALDLAARSASVSYRVPMPADVLRDALTGAGVSRDFLPHLHTLLDEAPVALLAAVVEQLHIDHGNERALVWQRMRMLAGQLKTSRALWQ